MSAFGFRDIEVVSQGEAPTVQLHGSAARRAASLGVDVCVSLTHTRRDAAAVAVTRRSPSAGPQP
jgi:phosphopantetheinyl transferase (holo-ACP synthase)